MSNGSQPLIATKSQDALDFVKELYTSSMTPGEVMLDKLRLWRELIKFINLGYDGINIQFFVSADYVQTNMLNGDYVGYWINMFPQEVAKVFGTKEINITMVIGPNKTDAESNLNKSYAFGVGPAYIRSKPIVFKQL
jgi:hypothetical protein